MRIFSESNIAENKVDQAYSPHGHVREGLDAGGRQWHSQIAVRLAHRRVERSLARACARVLMRINKLRVRVRVREGQANRRCADCITTNT